MSDQQVPQKISKEMANQSFTMVVQAVNSAMSGQFPVGLDHVEMHLDLKRAMMTLGSALKEYYGDPPVTSPKEVTPEVPDPVASDPEKKAD